MSDLIPRILKIFLFRIGLFLIRTSDFIPKILKKFLFKIGLFLVKMSDLTPTQFYILGFRWQKLYDKFKTSYTILKTLEKDVKYISSYHICHWTFTIMELRQEWLDLIANPVNYIDFIDKIVDIDIALTFYMSIFDGGIYHCYKHKKD